jgi:hypothetical protein
MDEYIHTSIFISRIKEYLHACCGTVVLNGLFFTADMVTKRYGFAASLNSFHKYLVVRHCPNMSIVCVAKVKDKMANKLVEKARNKVKLYIFFTKV